MKYFLRKLIPPRSTFAQDLTETEAERHASELHPPTQETTALAVEECVTPDRISVSGDCVMLQRISLIGG